ALGVLTAKERAAILLFEIAGFSIEEIVTIQKERSLSAVKSRLSRARKKLKKQITEQEIFSVRSDDPYGDLNGDLETETLNLIAEIRSER
ncbi:MAG TPA: sigma factor-like helix-turn-helix DNA-binding protein, partial [Ignavibacteria bacterium]|nr:sigma factor-like helix-turn-helix DNA-binding protein [Ignavibacteria bacterium]